MKMNAVQIEQTLRQIDAEAIPDDHPVLPQLEQIFGDHTYFLDSSGLNIVEPALNVSGSQTGLIVNVANWADANAPDLVPHEPEATDMVVRLSADSRH